MNIREKQEIWEKEYLSTYASLSQNSLGRDRDCLLYTSKGWYSVRKTLRMDILCRDVWP